MNGGSAKGVILLSLGDTCAGSKVGFKVLDTISDMNEHSPYITCTNEAALNVESFEMEKTLSRQGLI